MMENYSFWEGKKGKFLYTPWEKVTNKDGCFRLDFLVVSAQLVALETGYTVQLEKGHFHFTGSRGKEVF